MSSRCMADQIQRRNIWGEVAQWVLWVRRSISCSEFGSASGKWQDFLFAPQRTPVQTWLRCVLDFSSEWINLSLLCSGGFLANGQEWVFSCHLDVDSRDPDLWIDGRYGLVVLRTEKPVCGRRSTSGAGLLQQLRWKLAKVWQGPSTGPIDWEVVVFQEFTQETWDFGCALSLADQDSRIIDQMRNFNCNKKVKNIRWAIRARLWHTRSFGVEWIHSNRLGFSDKDKNFVWSQETAQNE